MPHSGLSQLWVGESPPQTGLSHVGNLSAQVTVKFRVAGTARSRSPTNVIRTCRLSLQLLCLQSSDLPIYREGTLCGCPQVLAYTLRAQRPQHKEISYSVLLGKVPRPGCRPAEVTCPSRANHRDQGGAPADRLWSGGWNGCLRGGEGGSPEENEALLPKRA